MARDKEWSLYHHPIRSTFRITLAEQVYDALCREIHGGRWQVGDRLPGASALAEMSGLSHNVVQRALETLREDGYVRQEKRKGTFLESILPKGMKSRGVIGIAMTKSEEGASYHFDHIHLSRMHAIIKAASDRGYTTEVLCLDEEKDWSRVDWTDGPFGDRVKGILCLHSFEHMDATALADDQIPMVFLEAPHGISRPAVYHDGEYAIYRATRQVIEAGHRNIALYCGHPHPDCGFKVAYAGFEKAMKSADLPINREAIEESLKHDGDDVSGMREFLIHHSDATAIITITSAKARRFVAICDVLGIRIPEDLSLVSQASAPMRIDDHTRRITGSKADAEMSVEVCFDLLLEYMNTRHSAKSLIILKPNTVAGDTLAPPRTEKIPILTSIAASLRRGAPEA